MKKNKRVILIAGAVAVAIALYVYKKQQASKASAADQSLADQQALGGFGAYNTPMPTGGVSSYPQYLPAPQTDTGLTAGMTAIEAELAALGKQNIVIADLLSQIDHRVPAPGPHDGKEGPEDRRSNHGRGGKQSVPMDRQKAVKPNPKRDKKNPGHFNTTHKGKTTTSSSAPHNKQQHKRVAPPQHQRARPDRQVLGR